MAKWEEFGCRVQRLAVCAALMALPASPETPPFRTLGAVLGSGAAAWSEDVDQYVQKFFRMTP